MDEAFLLTPPEHNPQPRPMGFLDVPPLRYFGSKWQIADWIVKFFPPHQRYVEPFSGAAAVFMRKQPSAHEVLNDLSGDIVNFFRVLRTHTRELVTQIALTPFAHEEFLSSHEPTDDPIEAARRYYVRCLMGFGATGHKPNAAGFRRQRRALKRSSLADEWNRSDGLWGAAAALKDAVIESMPALELVPYYDSPDTLFYVDPPYLHATRVKKTGYAFEMTDADHIALAETLKACAGYVVLSGYYSPLYEELYAGWARLEKQTTTNGNSPRTESLWLSPRTATDAPNLRQMALL